MVVKMALETYVPVDNSPLLQFNALKYVYMIGLACIARPLKTVDGQRIVDQSTTDMKTDNRRYIRAFRRLSIKYVCAYQ